MPKGVIKTFTKHISEEGKEGRVFEDNIPAEIKIEVNEQGSLVFSKDPETEDTVGSVREIKEKSPHELPYIGEPGIKDFKLNEPTTKESSGSPGQHSSNKER